MKTASGHRRSARIAGMAERTPKALASYEAAQTTERLPRQATMTGLPRSCGSSRCSTEAYYVDDFPHPELAKYYLLPRTSPINQGGFLLHYLDRLVYPDISPTVLTVAGVFVCALNLALYARLVNAPDPFGEMKPNPTFRRASTFVA